MPQSNAVWGGQVSPNTKHPNVMQPGSSLPAILGALRIILHVSFAIMLGVGLIRFVVTFSGHPAVLTVVVILVFMLAGLYVVGTVAEIGYAHGRSTFDPTPLTGWWLVSIVILWAGLILSSMSFAWVSFPLFFLVLHVYSPRLAGPVIVVMVATIVLSSVLHPTGPRFDVAYLLGPVIGACVAVVVSVIYRALVSEAEKMRQAFAQLRQAQTQIALAEHQAGRASQREELAADVHDTLAQGLTSILLLARTLKDQVGTPVATGEQSTEQRRAALATIATIEETAQSNLTQAREFLSGSPLGPNSVIPAVQAACHAMARATSAVGAPIACACEVIGDPVDVGEARSQVITRGVQSLLSNVALHSQASRAKVTLTYWENSVSVDVVDNGTGFSGTYGYGLRSLSGRVRALGGSLTIESGPGCAVRVSLPGTGSLRQAPGPVPERSGP